MSFKKKLANLLLTCPPVAHLHIQMSRCCAQLINFHLNRNVIKLRGHREQRGTRQLRCVVGRVRYGCFRRRKRILQRHRHPERRNRSGEMGLGTQTHLQVDRQSDQNRHRPAADHRHAGSDGSALHQSGWSGWCVDGSAGRKMAGIVSNPLSYPHRGHVIAAGRRSRSFRADGPPSARLSRSLIAGIQRSGCVQSPVDWRTGLHHEIQTVDQFQPPFRFRKTVRKHSQRGLFERIRLSG